MTQRLEPPQLATDARFADFVPVYHNSGPVPNNAYRTGAVGIQVGISSLFIVSALLEMAQLPYCPAGRSKSVYGERLRPELIQGAACSALVHLDAPAEVTRSSRAVIKALASDGPPQGVRASRRGIDAAIESIVLLRDVLRDRQLLSPFHGLVSCVSYDHVKEQRPLPWLSCSADDRIAPLAWGLVAIACASPPVLLLGRQPSLMWFHLNHSMMVRWFGVPPTSATAVPTGAPR